MKNWLKRLREDERGLTLVELLAVIVILGIVGSIAFVSVGNIQENSKKDAHVANAQQLISAAKLAEASQGWPDGGFSTDPTNFDGTKELDTIETMTNPWDSEADYAGKVEKDGDVYKVTIEGASDTIPDDITITAVNEDIINQGRDAVEAEND